MKIKVAVTAMLSLVGLGGCERKPSPPPSPGGRPKSSSTTELPETVVEASSQDIAARLRQARALAHERWPEFAASVANPPPRSWHSVKTSLPTTHDGVVGTEFLWVRLTSLRGDVIEGVIANEPIGDNGYALGDPITILKHDVEDWTINIPPDTMIGGFSVQALLDYQRETSGK